MDDEPKYAHEAAEKQKADAQRILDADRVDLDDVTEDFLVRGYVKLAISKRPSVAKQALDSLARIKGLMSDQKKVLTDSELEDKVDDLVSKNRPLRKVE